MREEAIKLIIERNNITGALKNALLGEEVEVPDGVKEDDFLKQEIDKHAEERKDFFKAKYADPLIKEAVEKKAKELYPATINPIRNKAITLFDLDKDKFKEADPKELLEAIYENNKNKVKAAANSSSGSIAEYQHTIEEQKKTIIDLKESMTEIELKHKRELDETAAREKVTAQEYVRSDLFGKEFDSISDQLVVKGRGLLKTAEIHLKEHGYIVEVEKDSKDKNILVAKAADGTSAMSLDGNRKVSSVSELLLEIAEAEGYKKGNRTGDDPNPLFVNGKLKPTKTKTGETVDYSGAKFLEKKMGQKI